MDIEQAIRHDIRARQRLPEPRRPALSDYLERLIERLDPWRLEGLTRHAEALVSDRECRA